MTIQQLFSQGVRRVRLPSWEPGKYLVLEAATGICSTWPIALWAAMKPDDPELGFIKVGIWNMTGDVWEEYREPAYSDAEWDELFEKSEKEAREADM